MNEEPPPEKRRWRKPVAAAEGGGRGEGAPALTSSPRRVSSRRWIERQLSDPYVRKAKQAGWRARSAYKLVELDERFKLIRPGAFVADLGAAPGGWSQAALARGAARVVGLDILPVEPLPGAAFLLLDISAPEAAAALIAALGRKPDLVLSDMAANTTGHKPTDQIRTGHLAELAAAFALQSLAPGGAFLTKAFQGGLEAGLLSELKRAFAAVRHAKPPASRAESPEIYVVAQGFRGGP